MAKPETGRASERAATGILADEWAMAHEMNQTHPGDGEWVPVRAIVVRKEINPRLDARLDWDRVREYAQVFFDLPPVAVQRDTFVLIDGNHRYNASIEKDVTSTAIRVREVDVPDEDLREAAFDANREHGVQLSMKERMDHLRYLLGKHGTDWDDAAYATACGISQWTVQDHRRKAGMTRQRAGVSPLSKNAEPDSDLVGTNTERDSELDGDDIVAEKPVGEQPSKVLAYPGTHFDGGKPAGFFPVGSQVVDLSSGEVVTLTAKSGDWATITFSDGETYQAHVTKDLRFAPVPGAAAPSAPVTNPVTAPPPVPSEPGAYQALRDAIVGLANAWTGVEPEAFEASMTAAEVAYYRTVAEPVLGKLATFVDGVS